MKLPRIAYAAMLGLAAMAWTSASAPLVSRAFSGTSFSGVCNSGHVIDPELTVNALTAVPSTTSREYADIAGVSVGQGPTLGTSLGSISQLAITVNTCGDLTTWPKLNGDSGLQLNACVDPVGNEAISGAGAPNGTVVGLAGDGGPIFDGPRPASQGYKFCAYWSGGVSADYGVALYDPIGEYLFTSANSPSSSIADLHDNNGTPTISAPSVSGSSVTFYFPYVWISSAPDKAHNNQRMVQAETIMRGGDSVRNLVTSAWVTFTDPVTSQGLLALTNWAPGYEVCSTPVVGCSQGGTGGFANGYDIGLSPVGYPASAVQSCVNTVPGPNGDVTCAIQDGTYTTYPCLANDSWNVPGQGPFPHAGGPPYYQNAGPAAPAPKCQKKQPGAAVLQPYHQVRMYGRIQGPNTKTGYHVTGQYLPSGMNFTA